MGAIVKVERRTIWNYRITWALWRLWVRIRYKLTGDCGCVCGYTQPYGFVPEAECPIHDVPDSNVIEMYCDVHGLSNFPSWFVCCPLCGRELTEPPTRKQVMEGLQDEEWFNETLAGQGVQLHDALVELNNIIVEELSEAVENLTENMAQLSSSAWEELQSVLDNILGGQE